MHELVDCSYDLRCATLLEVGLGKGQFSRSKCWTDRLLPVYVAGRLKSKGERNEYRCSVRFFKKMDGSTKRRVLHEIAFAILHIVKISLNMLTEANLNYYFYSFWNKLKAVLSSNRDKSKDQILVVKRVSCMTVGDLGNNSKINKYAKMQNIWSIRMKNVDF